jgi:dienelactone hydrolase
MPVLALLVAVAATSCPSATFVTYEWGRPAVVNWTERTPTQVRSHSVLNQTLIVDTTVDLRPDGTASHATSQRTSFGEPADKPVTRELGEGAVFWSDFVTASLEQTLIRARALDQAKVTVPGASLWADKRAELEVERIHPTDWVVSVNKKRYEVLTDEAGCLLSATLGDRGVVIERRDDFTREQYPLWTAYGPPPDHAYDAADVAIKAPQGHTLAATFTEPRHHKGKLSAVVFITGISPHERNGGTAPFTPFRDLADTLTRAGFAIVRADDRGIGKSTGDSKNYTSFDKADDTQSQIAWLRARKEIDPKWIFVVGYSEGGTIASIVSGRDPTLAGMVSIAGDGVPPIELARYQTEIAVMADPAIAPADKQKEIEKQMAEHLTPHETSFMGLDPIALVRKVNQPALFLQGGNDLHVPPRSAERLANALRAAGNRDVTVQVFPAMGHMIVPDPVGLASYWVMAPGHLVYPPLQEAIVRWLLAHAQ